MLATVSQNTILLNQLISQFNSKSEKINSWFSQLNDIAENTLSNSSDDERLKNIEIAQYLIFQIRVSCAWEQAQIRQILTSSERVTDSFKQILRNREVYVTNCLNRLNELRDDISVIQKVAYVRRQANYWNK